MAESHVVEIQADEQKLVIQLQHHPLMEISASPGHLLLLKLWQREEDLFGRRMTLKESRIDSLKRELFELCCFFFIFHGFFMTILFNSSNQKGVCQKWWIPSFLSVHFSIVIIILVQIKSCRYWKVCRQLQRERVDNRGVTRCIQELRMKGWSFDLSKEPLHNTTRMKKSSSVEIKWKPITWCSHYLITISLVCVTALLFPASRFMLCL